jgi:phosphohistidine swiveling domain-containing protein
VNGRFARLLPLGHPAAVTGAQGAKAARLSAALRAGFPVLPGWVLPAAESRPAVRAAAAAMRGGNPASGRRAAASCPLDADLAAEVRTAVTCLGGRAIVRSSSPLEADPRWSGAFSSVAEVGPDDAATAVRSCWASAFAVDPLARLESCGLPLEALELGLLIQPEIRPAAGGLARVLPAAGPRPSGEITVIVDGVRGHPGALLSGWADGASAQVLLPVPVTSRPAHAVAEAEGALVDLLGGGLVAEVARLAGGIHRRLGDVTIEWAAWDGKVWLWQSLPAAARDHVDVTSSALPPVRCHIDPVRRTGQTGAAQHIDPAQLATTRERMPLLAAAVQARGTHLRGRPAAAGLAAGRLVACRPHERPPADCRDAILLVQRPVPALAPLVFAARGVIARTGAAGSHLAEVARSLSVPMVTGCHPETVTGALPPSTGWLAAIDGATGEVALLPA